MIKLLTKKRLNIILFLAGIFIFAPLFINAVTDSVPSGYFQCSRHGSGEFEDCGSTTDWFPRSDYFAAATSYQILGHRHGGSSIAASVCLFYGNGEGTCEWFNCSDNSCGTEYGGEHPWNLLGSGGFSLDAQNYPPGSDFNLYRTAAVMDAEVRVDASADAFYNDELPPPPPPNPPPPNPPPPPSCISNGQACGGNPSACCSNYCPPVVGSSDLCQSPTSGGLTVCNDGTTGIIIRRNGTVIFNIRSDSADNPNLPIPDGIAYDYGYGGPGTYTYTVHDAGCGSQALQVELGRAVVVVPGVGQPPPPPPPPPGPQAEPCDPSMEVEGYMVACDVYPYIVSPGQTVQISGFNLATIVDLLSNTGAQIPTTGTLNSSGTILTFTVPINTPEGTYGITVSGNFYDSNGVEVIGQSTSPAQQLTVTLTQPPPPSDDGEDEIIVFPPVPPFSLPLPLPPLPDATNFQELINFVFTYSIYLVGIAVFIMILYGGFLWLTSAANPGNIAVAKRYITNAIIGAVLLISAYAILYTINPELVGGGITLTGINPPPQQSAQGVSRLIATNELGAASAITAGCNIATELRDLTAVECPTFVADDLGLPLDPVMQTLDSAVNQQIGATTIQNSGNTGNGRRVVVLDTGYNHNHPELSSSYGGGWDFINKDNDPADDQSSGTGSPGHGSHVAGIITADGNDPRAKGVAPGAQIIAGKILDSQGKGYWSTMVEAIYWAINGPDKIYGTSDDFKPDVINISIGGGAYGGLCDNNDSTSQQLVRALQYARDHGALPVIAAGNLPGGVSMPGCISEAFTVGAVDSSNNIAGFSGRGQAVDIVAPGMNIYSSLLGNSYGTKSGTSMATPVVSGVAALIKTANPSYNVSQLEQALISMSCDLGPAGKDTVFGWGRVSTISGSCSPPPPPPAGVSGTISMSPASCTKGSIAGNSNCDTTVNYTVSGVTSSTVISIRKNGTVFQSITCSSPCTGQVNDPNPRAGIHLFTLNLPSGNRIAGTNAYIYTIGAITSNPNSSCSKNVIAANLNCDVTLTVDAPSIYPSQLLIKKDGNNWRLMPCSSSACNETIVDANPSTGIHTYALYNSTDNSRLARTTIFINVGTGTGPTPTPTPCVGCPPSVGILEICHPNERPTQTFSCDAGLSVPMGQSIQLKSWHNISGDRVSWIDITNFVRWQGCNNSGNPCDDTWFLAPGLFEGRTVGNAWINASYGGISDQTGMTVTP